MSTSTPISRRERELKQDKEEAKKARDEAEVEWKAARNTLEEQWNELKDEDKGRKAANVKELKQEYEKKDITYTAKDKELDELLKELVNGQRRKRGKSSTI